ncbi:MAG: hypothetical protein E7335_09370 [Clostridiales bacterium]|nr:hypothetical protein [Clostridiales bacterium]
MGYNIGETNYGFTVVRVHTDAEVPGRVVEMVHDKSGAKVCWLDNGINNKLFSVAFKTLPEDSTGVFHILEHSVLCGSRKYPIKAPFVELMKSSMNTFLNAMTFPDKTMYPVSSRNEQDFLNLASVYLDATFAPRILDNPNIFYQEGHHIEQTADGMQFKGVVFNEMKGAMSSVERVIGQKIGSMLFPDNCYGFNSGGAPEAIPDLTYEQFCASYRKYYHPSNAYFVLDGAIPMDKLLPMIDEYLVGYEKSNEKIVIELQKPVSSEETQYYEISRNEDSKNKSHFTMGKIIGTWDEKVKNLAVNVLIDVLTGSNVAVLKAAILGSGLAQNVSLRFSASGAQPYIVMDVENVADGKEKELRKLIHDTVGSIVAAGIDRNQLIAAINQLEFNTCEAEEPQALHRAIRMLGSWLYDGDPMMNLRHKEDFATLRAMLDGRDFEKLLREMLMDEEGMAILHTLPSYTLGENREKAEKARVEATVNAWTEEERAANIRLNEELAIWQKTPDTEENLAKFPILSLNEIDDKPEEVFTEEDKVMGATVLYHPVPKQRVIHTNAYFSLTDCTLEELTAAGLMVKLFTQLPTAKNTTAQLQEKIRRDIGRINFGLQVHSKKNVTKECTPYIVASMSVLEDKLEEAQRLMAEILITTRFGAEEKQRIREIVMQEEMMTKRVGINSGHSLGMLNTLSRYSADAAVDDAVAGFTRIQWIHDLAANFDERYDALAALMRRIRDEAVCRRHMVASVTAGEKIDLSGMIALYPEGNDAPAAVDYKANIPQYVGNRVPAQIGFAVRGYHLNQMGLEHTGSYQVTANMLSLDYLWDRIRLQGGAYGAGFRMDRSGRIYSYSYRDPSPGKSLKIYEKITDHLRAFVASGAKLDKYIISAVGTSDPLRGAKSIGDKGDHDWLNGYTFEDDVRFRREMLATTPEKMLECCDILDKFVSDGAVSVVAPDSLLKECGELEIVDL